MKQLNSTNRIEEDAFEREMSLLYQLPEHPNIVRCKFLKNNFFGSFFTNK